MRSVEDWAEIRRLHRAEGRLPIRQIARVKGISSSSASGSYAGGVYFGAIQMLAEPTGRRMAGKWTGFGRGPGD